MEQIKIRKEKLKELFNSWIKGETVTETYTDKDGNERTRILVNKNRIYFPGNWSLRMGQDENNYYLGIDYFGYQDRIRVLKSENNKKQETKTGDVF
jgi:hypothetical protein